MINFFGKQTPNESSPDDRRLQNVEWKINVLLAMVATHLLLKLLSLASAIFLPSKSTLLILLVLLGVACWFLRDRILLMIRRTLAQQILGEEQTQSSSNSESSREGSIR